jgi:hypothetical protein
LGAGYEQTPSWTFRNNWLIETNLRLRRSEGATHTNNTMQGGHVQMGTPGDVPSNAIFVNQHYNGTTFDAQPGATWTPSSFGAIQLVMGRPGVASARFSPE